MKNQTICGFSSVKDLTIFRDFLINLSLLGSILLILIGCNVSEVIDSGSEFVQINLDEKESIGVDIKITAVIPLESLDSSIIGRVCRIQTYQDRIYVLDWLSSRSLFLFDKQGNFMKRIPQGKGPGECNNINDFCIDYDNQKILTWDQFLKRLTTFDLDLNYHNSIEKDLVIKQFEQLPDGDWLIFRRLRIDPSGQDYAYYRYSEDLDSIETKLLPIPRDATQHALSNPISREARNRIVFVKQYDQHVYSFGIEDVKVEYILDFGKYNIRESDFSNGNYRYPIELAKEGERVVNIDRLIHTNDFFAFSFMFKDFEKEYIIYSRRKKNYWYSKNLEKERMLPDGKLMCMADDNFVLACEPAAFNTYCESFTGELPDYCQQIEEGGNVVLIFFHIEVV